MVEATLIFDHDYHLEAVAEDEGLEGVVPENLTCAVCHAQGAAKTAESAKSCLDCHGEDHGWAEGYEAGTDLSRAPSYMEAMHENCVTCHEEDGRRQDRDTLRDCSTCHRSLGPGEKYGVVTTVAAGGG
jgi:hypothetical protein